VDEHAIAARLARVYPPERFALLPQVASIPGARVQGVRVIDLLAVALWPSDRGRVELVEIKCSADDWRSETPGKSAPFMPYASACWFAVPAPWQRVVQTKAIFRERWPGWGLWSVGTGKPEEIVPAERRRPTESIDPFTLSLLRAATRGRST
jgi:hypothetical protein